MSKKPMRPSEVAQALALIEKAHQLEDQQPSTEALSRARRVLEGQLSPKDAELELEAELRRIQTDERGRRSRPV